MILTIKYFTSTSDKTFTTIYDVLYSLVALQIAIIL